MTTKRSTELINELPESPSPIYSEGELDFDPNLNAA